MDSYAWSGSQRTYLDTPTLLPIGRVSVGLYGGNSSHGASKNEDGALLWVGADWVFAAIFDAHASAESTDAALALLDDHRSTLLAIIESGDASSIPRLLAAVIDLVSGPEARERFAEARGETACLVCVQRGRFLGWLSIGDNSLYLLHPQLARLGQYTLTARNYFEWIGQRDSLALEVPCYSSGIRELRQGEQTIALVTDGLLEFGDRPYEDPAAFADTIGAAPDLPAGIAAMLHNAHASGATDSATVIAWRVTCERQGLMPTS